MATEDRIDANSIRMIAMDLRSVAPNVSPMHIVGCVAGALAVEPAVVVAMPITELLDYYADYLDGKSDYTPGTHNRERPDQGILDHIHDYDVVSHRRKAGY